MSDEGGFEEIFTVNLAALGIADLVAPKRERKAKSAEEAESPPSERRQRKPRWQKSADEAEPAMSFDRGHGKKSSFRNQPTRRRAPVKMRFS